MTGFGAAAGLVEGVEYAVEIRSVNSRYYKATIKLPESLSAAEPEIEKVLRTVLSRGSIIATIKVKVPDAQAVCRVNMVALQSYLEQLRLVEVEANPSLRIDLGAMLQLPGVCEPAPLEEIFEKTRAGLLKLVNKAVSNLLAMRTTEGQSVKVELMAHCKMIGEQLKIVEACAPQLVIDYHQRLVTRVRELVASGNVQIDPDHLAREVAIFAERCDIAEEMARLRAHVEQFEQAVDSPEPAGRKLDFISQEMLREANTIASKANETKVARAVVEIKTAIDRIKEQVQNVE
ncbi:MAG: YicC/YloC family endoribonuclease [Phycisphaerae bacterium]|jgi:uncharacterized protein (TIGR00255 family)